MNEEMFNDWLLGVEFHLQKKIDKDGSVFTTEKLTATIEMGLLKDVLKVFKQSQCEHKNTELRENVGYDVDEEGEEDQHLEKCKDCGAERFHCDHTKHGKTTGGWFVCI